MRMHNQSLRVWLRVLLVILIAILIPSAGHYAMAQLSDVDPEDINPSLLPVIIQGHRDGLLLGGDFRIPVDKFEVGIGSAFGFRSRAARVRTVLDYNRLIALSYGDWPESLVLRRTGEQGIKVTGDVIALYRALARTGSAHGGPSGFIENMLQGSRLRGTLFEGVLWDVPGEAEMPEVQYAHLDASVLWPFSSGFSVATIGRLLIGRSALAPDSTFQAFTSTTRFVIGKLGMDIRMGGVENDSQLPDFQLELGLKSYPDRFTGNRFVLGQMERRFDILSQYITQLDLTPLLGLPLGWIPIYLDVDSSVYFEGGVILDNQNQLNEILFGWGAAFILPTLQTRVDVAVNRDGEARLIIETGFLPEAR